MLANFVLSLYLYLACTGFNYFSPFEPIEGSSECERKNSIKSKTQASTPLPILRIVLDPRPTFLNAKRKSKEKKKQKIMCVTLFRQSSPCLPLPASLSLSSDILSTAQVREIAICTDLSQGLPSGSHWFLDGGRADAKGLGGSLDNRLPNEYEYPDFIQFLLAFLPFFVMVFACANTDL